MSWVAVAVVGAGAIGAGTSAYQGAKNRAAMKDSQGYDVVEMPQWDFTESNQQRLSDQYNQGIDYTNQGLLPPGFQKFYDTQQEGMQQDLSERQYGSAGRPGTLRNVMGLSSVTGAGPKAALSKGLQAEYDYMTEGRKIDEYIAGLKSTEFGRQSMFNVQGLAGMSQGPQSQVVNFGGGVGQMSGGGQGMDLSALGSYLGNRQTTNTQNNMFSAPGITGTDPGSMYQYGGDLGGLDSSYYSNQSSYKPSLGGAEPSLFSNYKLSGAIA